MKNKIILTLLSLIVISCSTTSDPYDGGKTSTISNTSTKPKPTSNIDKVVVEVINPNNTTVSSTNSSTVSEIANSAKTKETTLSNTDSAKTKETTVSSSEGTKTNEVAETSNIVVSDTSKTTINLSSAEKDINTNVPQVSTKNDGETLRIILPGNLAFDSGKTDINSNFYSILDDISEILKKYDGAKIIVEGHTDNTGGRTVNMQISEKRAEAIKAYLAYGTPSKIDYERMEVKGVGPDKPLESNSTEDGRSKNRRVELILIK